MDQYEYNDFVRRLQRALSEIPSGKPSPWRCIISGRFSCMGRLTCWIYWDKDGRLCPGIFVYMSHVFWPLTQLLQLSTDRGLNFDDPCRCCVNNLQGLRKHTLQFAVVLAFVRFQASHSRHDFSDSSLSLMMWHDHRYLSLYFSWKARLCLMHEAVQKFTSQELSGWGLYFFFLSFICAFQL